MQLASQLEQYAKLVYELTDCLLGDVVQLIEDAAVMAIDRRDPAAERIDKDLLTQCAITRTVSDEDLQSL